FRSPDRGQAPAPGRPAVQGHVFTNDVALADDEARPLARVFEILRDLADIREGEEPGPAPDLGRPLADDSPADLDPVAEDDFAADDRVGADRHAGAEFRFRADDRRWVNHGK